MQFYVFSLNSEYYDLQCVVFFFAVITSCFMRNKLHINISANFVYIFITAQCTDIIVSLHGFDTSVICLLFISFSFQTTKLYEYSSHAKVLDKVEILAILKLLGQSLRISLKPSHSQLFEMQK